MEEKRKSVKGRGEAVNLRRTDTTMAKEKGGQRTSNDPQNIARTPLKHRRGRGWIHSDAAEGLEVPAPPETR